MFTQTNTLIIEDNNNKMLSCYCCLFSLSIGSCLPYLLITLIGLRFNYFMNSCNLFTNKVHMKILGVAFSDHETFKSYSKYVRNLGS